MNLPEYEIFAIKYDPKNTIDSLESKLFGIGAETFTCLLYTSPSPRDS